MSRVSYVMMNPGGEQQLTAAVRAAVDELVGELVGGGGTSRDRVLEVVRSATRSCTTCCWASTRRRSARRRSCWPPRTRSSCRPPSSASTCPTPGACVGPCIAGHVGADTTAAMLAEGPHRGDAMQLLVDVGTNAEIVLGDRHRQFAASSPTGPAFEGAQISCGQRATTGADRAGADRPGDAGAAVQGDRHATRGPTSRRSPPPDRRHRRLRLGDHRRHRRDVPGRRRRRRRHDPARAGRATRARRPDGRTFAYVLYERRRRPALTITQNDVRAIQLAKAALRAGIELLLDHAGRPEVTDIRLAGAFGAHIDPVHAMVLGLVPDCPVEGVRSVGNAAGAGAVHALLSRAQAGRAGRRRPRRREDRDGDRAAVPGAVRGRDGVPPRHAHRHPTWPASSSCPPAVDGGHRPAAVAAGVGDDRASASGAGVEPSPIRCSDDVRATRRPHPLRARADEGRGGGGARPARPAPRCR